MSSSGLPFTEDERAEMLGDDRRVLQRGFMRRRATPSGQAYGRKPTKLELVITRRIVGEA